ncbi:MAG: type II toxin-antitoxin system VapB family antitoxin [Propionibacteriaceae bacterium]|nr:type II toxin-antitoxin system VapB family antitoxin [Propionibacteriaceae bacterium]
MTKILVEVDDALMEAARTVAAGRVLTKKAAVNLALEEMVRRHGALSWLEFARAGGMAELADPDVVREAQR